MTPDLAGMVRIAGALLFLAFILAGVLAGERKTPTTDWNALATDADQVDDYAGDIPPVTEDKHGDLVCAAPVDGLPGGICGWPVKHDPCPAHGRLVRGAA